MICTPSRSASRSYLAAVLQEIGTDPDLGSLRNDGARPTADHRSEDLSCERTKLKLLPLRGLRGGVPQHDVTELVRDHAGDLAVVSRRIEHAAIHEDWSPGKRKGIDVPAIDNLERISELRLPQSGRNRRDQTLADPSDVVLYLAIADNRQFPPKFRSRAPAQFDILGRRESIRIGIDACLRGCRRRDGQTGGQDDHEMKFCTTEYESHAEWQGKPDASTDRA